MKTLILFLPLTLFLFSSVEAQEAFKDLQSRIVGHWQSDLASLKNKRGHGESMVYESLSERIKAEVDEAMASREFFFSKDGGFAAKWIIGGNVVFVDGTWYAGEKESIMIEIQGVKSEYLVHANGPDGLALIPQRARHGLVHELYFSKKKE